MMSVKSDKFIKKLDDFIDYYEKAKKPQARRNRNKEER